MPEACKLNNEAVFCIKNGEYEKSIQLLQQAAKFLRTTMTTSSCHQEDFSHYYCEETNGADFCRFLPDSGATLDSCFSTTTTLPPTTPTRTSKRTEHEHTTTTATSTSSTSCYHAVFNSPVLVNHTVSLNDATALERLSYVIVYNLALVHHFIAMNYYMNDSSAGHHLTQQEATAKSYQKKAVMLYEKSHALLARASQKWDVPVLHSLAILCNLGHVHHAMGDENKSEACYKNLISMLFYIIEQQQRNQHGAVASASHQYHRGEEALLLTEGLLDRFLYNVMPLLQKGGVAAAA